MPSEAQARVTINKLLEAAGWRFVPDAQGRRENVVCEHRVTGKLFPPNADLGQDFEKAPDGFVDYVLLNDDGKAVAVVESKKEGIDPLTAKEQARAYAENLRVAHIYLSNGLAHYYWNLLEGNPVRVSRFLPLEHLGAPSQWRPDAARLAAESVDENYIAESQVHQWRNFSAAERQAAMTNQKVRLLRDYQVAAVRALQSAVSQGRNRFLFEMATGTGKTLLSAAVAKLFLRTENATRILFLVDRLELETQAWRHFRAYLENDGIRTVIYKQKRQEWRDAEVVVTTIQSLAARNRFLTEFAPADFQLLISDEAHRTISGNNRAIFEYFIGAKLGLTATPRDYLKGVDQTQMREDDPRALERRLLLDSYRTFGCEDGQPTFRFSLLDAVRHAPPYLVNPVAIDARTEITTQMLAEEGYTVTTTEDGEEVELTFEKRDYERRFFSDETNLSFVRCFLKNARRDPITGEIGKTILFAVSRRHATKLVKLLNEEATRLWPEHYGAGSSFAVQVTSDIPGAQQMALDFANNNLNGKSKYAATPFPDYNTCRTRVCVTVGMMTTGYDCEDLLNVVLARPIFSPTDFIQIKGRGTRLMQFKYTGTGEPVEKRKANFVLLDFFANCQYFEHDFDYDQRVALPKPASGSHGGETGEPTGDFTNTAPDPVNKVMQTAVGTDGMKIDREMYRERFAAQANEALGVDEALRGAVEAEDWAAVEALVRQSLFDKPEEFWNLEKLRDLYRTDRDPSLREILQHIFGFQPRIRTREDLAGEQFDRFTAGNSVAVTRQRELREFFTSYLLDGMVRTAVDTRSFGTIAAMNPSLSRALRELADDERSRVLRFIRDEVPLNEFMPAA